MREGAYGGLGAFALSLLLLGSGSSGVFCDEVASASAAEAGSGVDLARLAAIEQGGGNGGAEETEVPITAGWDKKDGFFLRSKDDNFLLKIAGRLQFRYTYKARDQKGDAPDTPEEEGADDSFFELERVRFQVSGHVLDPTLTYMFSLDGDTDDEGVLDTFYAYVYFLAARNFGYEEDLFNLGLGQWKPHFLRQEATSSANFQLVERSLANEFFNIDRNLGIWVDGSTGPMFYEVAVTNGFDSNNVASGDVDQIPAFIGHLDFTLLGENEKGKYEEGGIKNDENPFLAVGVSGATDQNNGSSGVGDPEWKAYTFGLDALFRVGGFSLQGEYMGRWLDYDDSVEGVLASGGDLDTNYAHGFYAQAGLFLVPSTLEVTGRVSAVWSDSSTLGGTGFEAGPGLNWYISKSHKIKVQTDVMYIDIDDDLPNPTENLDDTSPSFSSSSANIQSGEQGVMWRTQLQLSF
jgi:phosphate-selective porin